MKKSERTLTVAYENRYSQSRFATATTMVRECPSIKLSGKWLADCGFLTGDKISVKVEQNRLVITKN